jgi:hypothetical protein
MGSSGRVNAIVSRLRTNNLMINSSCTRAAMHDVPLLDWHRRQLVRAIDQPSIDACHGKVII